MRISPLSIPIVLLAVACGGSSSNHNVGDDGGLPDSGVLPDGGTLECGAQTACGTQCVDVASDPANCGACAHSCQGGTCSAGACQPVVLAQGEVTPGRLALNGSWLYWTSYNGGTVKRVPIAGGPVETLASGQKSLTGLCADDARVYWTGQSGGDAGIWSATLDGGAPELLLASGTSNTLVRFGDRLYWGTPGRTLSSVFTDGGSYTSTAVPMIPTDIASDGQQLYWGAFSSGQTSQGGIFRSGFDGANVEQLAPAAIVARIALGPGEVAWLDGVSLQYPQPHYGDAGIWTAPVDGGAPRLVAPLAWQNSVTDTGAFAFTGGLASDARYLYWTDMDAGVLFREAWGTDTIEPVVTNQELPVGLISDSTALYWSTFGLDGGGTVMKLAK